uniref:Zf-AD domain-containing protein n=1 Tax=Bursaphelenchus xylophilus TaxID=6326 RepID=A0A1I7S3E1_BURXY
MAVHPRDPMASLKLPLSLRDLPKSVLTSSSSPPQKSDPKFPEFTHGIGVVFDYQTYFKKKRDKHSGIKLNSALEFTAKLERYAIRMAKENSKINRLLRPKHPNLAPKCSICELFLLENPATVYFHIWSSDTKNAMSLSWNQVPRNVAKEIGDGEYLSGPVDLCNSCTETMKWAQERIEWHRMKRNIRNGKDLPAICDLYTQVPK